ncbi:MAG: PD-(D/E)XK nuclease family protein [Candidatus Eremiobacteraeota bacterium]|nr:PD-(D/E)XK nuclease family protein [Candidatus Eremiobacteraeota bacterium]
MIDPFVAAGDALALRLVSFVRDLVAYAPQNSDDAARRALRSPYSGLPNADAAALCVAAGERRTVEATIAADRVPLSHESTLTARRFGRTLHDLGTSYRAQGATACEYLRTIEIGYRFREQLDERESATFASLVELAGALDAQRPAGDSFDAATLSRALERAAEGAQRAAAPQPQRRPFAPREPEEPQNVPRRTKHLSASSLGTFAECERRWFYRYVCAAVEDRGSSASFYGTAFHSALERFHEEFPRADAAPREVLERKLDGHLNSSFEHHRVNFATNVEFELQRRRALRTGRRYLTWFIERFRAHPFSVIGTEAAVELELDGYQFIGYIDRLDRDDRSGNVTVVDYKTGTIADSAERYRDKVARFIDFQLPFYYFARTAAGDTVSRLALVPLKDAIREVEPIELEVVAVSAPRSYSEATTGTIGIDELEHARVKMTELAALLVDGPLERFKPTDDAAACAYCAYATACRERPQRQEDRFGR